MLEHNTFRSMMMLAGVVVVGLLSGLFFKVPIVDITDQNRIQYENVMNVTLDDDVDKLTAYDTLLYSLKARERGSVDHY